MRAPLPVQGLRWALGLVLGHYALLLLLGAHHGGPQGVPAHLAIALAVVEIAAAILFLVPRTTPLGAYGLLFSLLAATVIHLFAGETAGSGWRSGSSSFSTRWAAPWISRWGIYWRGSSCTRSTESLRSAGRP